MPIAQDELTARLAERTTELKQANDVLREEITRRSVAETAGQQLLRRLVTVQENEGLRISREMHDVLGQDLATLMLRLDAIETAISDTATRALLTDAEVSAVVEDNGRGFDPALVSSAQPDSLGLIGMRERSALFGGKFTIESDPGGGTAVFVRVPSALPA